MHDISLDDYDRIIGAIYSAPIEDDWQPVIEVLSQVMGGIHTQFFGYDMLAQKQLALQCQRYDPAMVATYAAHYYDKNAWLPGIARSRVGKATHSENYCPTDELVKTEFFNDWIRPQEEIGGGGGILLFNDGNRFVVLGGNIRFRDRDQREGQWIGLLDRLAPHLRRAFLAWQALAEARFVSQGYREALERTGYAVFLLARDGRALHCNRPAQRLSASGGVFRLDAFRVLRTVDPFANRLIEAALAALRTGPAASLPEIFPIRDAGGASAHPAMILPFPAGDGALAGLDREFGAERPFAMLIVRDSSEGRRPATHLLASLYRLTPAEAELAAALAEGHSLKSYAEWRSLSINTVRNQLQAVFSKTATKRQSELVRLLERLRAA